MFRSENPHVVAIRTATQTPDRICLGMPYYRGGSLAGRIGKNPLSLCDVLRIGREALAGLGAIHAAGTVHLDVKPSNILFDDNGAAMIADFGQARELDARGVVRLPARMYAPIVPPEATSGSWHGTVMSDIYQMGVTLYRAANGNRMFESQLSAVDPLEWNSRIASGKLPRRDCFMPHVPAVLRRIIRKAMNIDATKRFPSAIEFANALARVKPGNDWSATCETNRTKWVATRKGQPDLSVELRVNGSSCSVEIHTVNSGRRRRSRSSLWRDNLSLANADSYLSQLFATLR